MTAHAEDGFPLVLELAGPVSVHQREVAALSCPAAVMFGNRVCTVSGVLAWPKASTPTGSMHSLPRTHILHTGSRHFLVIVCPGCHGSSCVHQ